MIRSRAIRAAIAEAILAHPAHPWTLESLHIQLGYSKRTIQRALKNTETSFSNLLQQQRVEAATRMMRERPDLPINEVRRRVGYPHAGHFSEVFYRYTGRTPSEFKESLLEKEASS